MISKIICFVSIFALVFTLNASLSVLMSGTEFFHLTWVKFLIRLGFSVYLYFRFGDSLIEKFKKNDE